MEKYFVDLHVHIGRSSNGKEIKKATANNLTFENIAHDSLTKGINIIGVVDCISPYVLEDIDEMIERKELVELSEGGLKYREKQCIIPGAEIETHEKHGCSAHSLCFFSTLNKIKAFSTEMSKHMRDIRQSSLMSRLTGQGLFDIVDGLGGILIPAHAFTPHKSFYGNCCSSLHEIFNDRSFSKIFTVELGLSADTAMASHLSELDGKTFISNSDAHSIPKMGREYNIFEMENANYNEVLKTLKNEGGRRIAANYGLNPLLGKYHRTFCDVCNRVVEGTPPVLKCPVSDRHAVVVGVRDRLELIRDRDEPDIDSRPPYIYQVPLEFLPKVGPKTIEKLVDSFGSEMNVLHDVSFEELAKVVKEDIARNIVLAREGKLGIEVGGGGVYGKIEL
ncbi:endonuclease Q family protein [Pseudobacteroides cellulosolvens]|uniref:PHP domain protein n=1 Tax=Pseudobacteroides cellulosolvens ATCC 35603 = DSM 2933 TaxID=398512 RepID=A0A0L6JHF6_9FIRM|nr:endonuclease Q family protein [Pseudobacteroides cellulosolvens]KNY25145.1 hypothetical protein Bccel_0402 [Pseudobacteroides cellulosolvens ATCC 35603 = DSM 2933]